jgi:hypothetical protein
MKALNETCINVVKGYVAQATKTDKVRISMADTLHAEGVTAAMCTAPAKGEDRTFFDSLKAAVVLGFTAQVQGLLAKPTKGLTDQQKTDKRYWQQQIGARVNDITRALAKREAQDEDGDGANNTSRWEDRTKKALTAMIDAVQKKDGVSIVDVGAFVKDLKAAVARIK